MADVFLKKDWTIQPVKGKKPIISWEAVADLKVDHAYQRAIDSPASQRLIKEMASQWDWGLCSVLTVSDRGTDGLFVVDGQHRLAAAQLRGDLPHLPCITAQLPTRDAEAKLFVKVNTQRKTVTALDKFNARCIAGDQEALSILDLVERAGLKVGKSSWSIKDNEVCCVAVMTRLYREYGDKLLSAALVNIAEAWPGEGMRIAAEMLPALCLLHLGADGDIDPDFLPDVLRSRKQVEWFAGAFSEHNEDPESSWPDEVFRDVVLSRYREMAAKRPQMAAE